MQLYIKDETKELLEIVAKADDRKLANEMEFLVKRRASELNLTLPETEA